MDDTLLRAAIAELNEEYEFGTFAAISADSAGDGAAFAYRADTVTLKVSLFCLFVCLMLSLSLVNTDLLWK